MLAVITFSTLSTYLWPFTLVAGAVIGYMIFRSTYSKENNDLKEDLINTRGQKILDLEADVKGLKSRDDEQQKLIEGLQKELNTWRDVPIKQLSEDYHKLTASMIEMNGLIKKLLENRDGDRPAKRRNTQSK